MILNWDQLCCPYWPSIKICSSQNFTLQRYFENVLVSWVHVFLIPGYEHVSFHFSTLLSWWWLHVIYLENNSYTIRFSWLTFSGCHWCGDWGQKYVFMCLTFKKIKKKEGSEKKGREWERLVDVCVLYKK